MRQNQIDRIGSDDIPLFEHQFQKMQSGLPVEHRYSWNGPQHRAAAELENTGECYDRLTPGLDPMI